MHTTGRSQGLRVEFARLAARAVLVVGLALASAWSLAGVAYADGPLEVTEEEDSPFVARAKLWRGSTVVWELASALRNFDPAQEPTYDPYVIQALKVRPRLWVHKKAYIEMHLGVWSELTHSNFTTYANEPLLTDLRVAVGSSKMVEIPVLGVNFDAKLNLLFPTSKFSQHDTLMVALSPSFSLRKRWDVLGGIDVGYGFRATKFFHEYTTSANADERYAGCLGSDLDGLSSCLNTGIRNVSIQLINSFDVGFAPIDELGLSVSFAVYTNFLYSQGENVDAVGPDMQEPTDVRHALGYTLELWATPWPPLTIAVGVDTVNPQLKPDSSRYAPFINRYSNLYVGLRLDLSKVVRELAPSP